MLHSDNRMAVMIVDEGLYGLQAVVALGICCWLFKRCLRQGCGIPRGRLAVHWLFLLASYLLCALALFSLPFGRIPYFYEIPFSIRCFVLAILVILFLMMGNQVENLFTPARFRPFTRTSTLLLAIMVGYAPVWYGWMKWITGLVFPRWLYELGTWTANIVP